MLPELTSEGLLPPGRHPATLQEVEQRFVDQAPNAEERSVVWRTFEIWLGLLARLLPGGTLWINGGFTTHKAVAPADVDVVLLAEAAEVNGLSPSQKQQLCQLITLQGVVAARPVAGLQVDRVQPMGGLVDAFIVGLSDPAGMKFWHDLWSTVTDERKQVIPGRIKGYVEVSW